MKGGWTERNKGLRSRDPATCLQLRLRGTFQIGRAHV